MHQRLLKGSVRFYRRGKNMYVAKWPRPTSNPPTPRKQAQNEWFQSAIDGIRWVDVGQLQAAIDWSRPTLYMPRDVLMMAMAGNLYTWTDESGVTYYPRKVAMSIQNGLDSIGQTEGNVLARGPVRWQALAPGSVGYVLQSNGPGQLPSWVAPSAAPSILSATVGNPSPSSGADFTPSWGTVDIDDSGFFDPANPTRLTVPGNGRCRLTAQGGASSSAPSNANIRIFRNGSSGDFVAWSTMVGYGGSCQSGWFPCVAGDYFEVRYYFSSSRSLAIRQYNFSIDYQAAS
jgi:hypothetical protein